MQNQIDLVELTKSRLIGLHEFKKLGKNAMETIIRSINPKATLDSTNHLATYLPPKSCDKIFQHLLVKLEQIPEENQREYLDKIDFLLTEETKFLDLGDVFPKRRSIPVIKYYAIDDAELKLVTWVIDKVKNQAPFVEHIVFNNMRFYFDNNRHMNFIDDLTNFQQLKKLVMVLIDLETPRVLNLCRKLPQLQTLEIGSFFEDEMSDGVTVQEIRQSLRNLRLLVGYTEEWQKRDIQQQFPHLNIASFIQNGALSTFRPVKHEDFLVDEIGTPPQRKYFSCGEDWSNSPVMEFPDVTYLEITFEFYAKVNSRTLRWPNFSKIQTLIARNCSNETIIEEMLKKYGKGLRSLWLESLKKQSYDVKLLELCPELEAIQLDRIRFTDTPTQLVNLPRLEELYLVHTSEERGSLLPKILSFPRLKNIEIYGLFVKEDLVELNAMVSASQIFQELESIKISTRIRVPDAFRELLGFLENASAYLPNLKDILFTYEDENYVDVARRLVNGQNLDVVEIRNIIVNNVSLVPILESFSRLRT